MASSPPGAETMTAAQILAANQAAVARATGQVEAQQAAARAPLSQAATQAAALAHQIAVGTLRYVGAGRVWVRQAELGTVLKLDPPTKTCTVALQTDAVVAPVAPLHVSYGSGSPVVGKSYPVFVPYTLSREPTIERGPVPDVSHLPWLLAPGGQTWLYYQDGGTLYRVDWPPALPPAPMLWTGLLTHAVATVTETGIGGSFTGPGSYLGPVTPPVVGLSIFFQLLSQFGETNFCSQLTEPEPTATTATLDHAGVEGTGTDVPAQHSYPTSEHAWMGSSNHGPALVGFHYDAHDYVWPVTHAIVDDPPIHLFSLFCGPQEYPQDRCLQHVEDAPLSTNPATLNPQITCIARTLHLVYSPDTGVTRVNVGTIDPAYAITRYNTLTPMTDRCSPVCTAGGCFLGILTCTDWDPCRPGECEWGYNFVGTGILNNEATLGYQTHYGAGAWTWHEDDGSPQGHDFNLWLIVTYDGRPPNPLLIDATVIPPILPPGEQSWNTPGYYQLFAGYGATAAQVGFATPNLGAGFDIPSVMGTAGFGLSGETLYAYVPCGIPAGGRGLPSVYRATAHRAPNALPGGFVDWTVCPISGVFSVSQDGQSVIGWYQKPGIRGFFWKYTVDAGVTWLDFPLPPNWHDLPNGGLVDQ